MSIQFPSASISMLGRRINISAKLNKINQWGQGKEMEMDLWKKQTLMIIDQEKDLLESPSMPAPHRELNMSTKHNLTSPSRSQS